MSPDPTRTWLPRPRRPRRSWSQLAARVMCVVLAVIGSVPLLLTALARSPLLNAWAAQESSKLLAAQGLHASYRIEVGLWPLELVLTDVRLDSSDGGTPALTSDRVSVRPRIFPLLSGKLAIDQIEIDQPRIRVWVQDGELKNLPITLPKSDPNAPKKPFISPFSVLAVTGASLDVTVDDAHVVADEVDVDLTTDETTARGSAFEIAARIGRSSFHRARIVYLPNDDTPELAVDDDALCLLDVRLRYEPGAILVRRLTGEGSADLDVALKTQPRCGLPQDDKRRVEVSASHLRVQLPEDESAPRIDGHVRLRAPVGLAQRAASLPQTDGWVLFDGDLRYAPDTTLPELEAHVEAHDIQLDKYRFAQEVQSELEIRKNVVTSPKTTVRIADGLATLTDVAVEPLAKGIPLRAKLDVDGVSFFELMRDLGVSDHPHVGWDVKELHVPLFKGTIVPLRLDGDLTGKTANFSVTDIAQDDPRKARIFGFKEAAIAAHVAVRSTALEFQAVRAQLERSQIEGGFVSIGFDNQLVVDATKVSVNLQDLSPLGSIALAGQGEVKAHVAGQFNDPRLEADLSLQSFVLGETPFGSVLEGHASFEGDVVDLRGLRVQKGGSTYDVPTARLDFGGKATMQLDAVATSTALGLRDFLAIWQLEDDPRFEGLDAKIATHADVHVAMGGPEDTCGGGFIDVRAGTHVHDVNLLGEHFDDGDFDLEYRWFDRLGGIAGADIDVRAFTLHKFHPAGKQPVGSVLGSARIRQGGGLHASVVMQGIPLYRIQSLGALETRVEGAVSGLGELDGTIDAFRFDADADVTPVRVRGVPLGPSHLHLAMTQEPSPQKPIGKTRCGNGIYAAFDKDAYLRDTSSHGAYFVDGDLFDGQVHFDHLAMTRQKAASITGRIAFQKADLGAFARILVPPEEARDGETPAPSAMADVHGELSGDLVIDRLHTDDLPHASIRFAPSVLVVSEHGQQIALRATKDVIRLEDDAVTLPSLVFDLETPHGLRGSFTLAGSVTRATRDPDLALRMDLAPIDLGIMAGVVPKVDRAQGTVRGSVRVTGKARAPEVAGELHVQGGELAVKGFPSVISDLEVDVRADTDEIQVTRASAHFAGGTVNATAAMPIRGLVFGDADARVVVRGVRLSPSEGISATLDADLQVDVSSGGASVARLPHVTGDVLITQFEYTRPINLASELGGLGVRAKRTVVQSYDPSLDALTLELRVRSKVPLRIRNNLVEVSLGIDSGALSVTGTNQRLGLRGDLKALPGGRFHLRANEFEIRQAYIRFDDPTRISPNVDVLAVTEYRRYTDTSAGAAAGAGASGASGIGPSRGGGLWRISLHAYGDADDLRFDMTSDPPLTQEDIVLLLTIGMTRAEVDQLQAGSLGASAAFEALATVSGADRAVKQVIPVIDDFRFGSAYSTRTGRTEPQVTVGKRLNDDVRASVTTSLTGDQGRELRANIEWRLGQRVSVQGSYDNINDVSSSTFGNVGVDLRWRLEFE